MAWLNIDLKQPAWQAIVSCLFLAGACRGFVSHSLRAVLQVEIMLIGLTKFALTTVANSNIVGI